MGGGKKSAKKKAKLAPLTAVEALAWDDVLTDTSTVVSDVIEEILWASAKALVAHIVEKKSIDRSAYDAVHYTQDAVEAMLMKHDYGEVVWLPGPEGSEGGDIPHSAWQEASETSIAGRVAMEQSWTLEEEPACIAIDRFGTGMVRSKSRVNKFTLGELAEGVQEADAGSTTSRSSASQKSSMGSKRATKKRKPKKEPEPERIPRKIDKDALKKEGRRLFELKKLEKKKKQMLRAREQEREIVEEKKRYEKIQKDLKGKNYILDEDGKIVLVMDPKPERMPPMTLEPKVGLHDPVAIQEQIEAMERKKSGKRKGSKKGSKKVTKPPEMQALDRSKFIDITTALGPPVISVFEAQLGVCFSQGLQTNRGPKRTGEGLTTMTRSQYNSHLETTHGKPVVMQKPSPMDGQTEQTNDGELEASVNLADGLTPAATLAPLEPSATLTLKRLSPRSAAAAAAAAAVPQAEPDDSFDRSIVNDPTWGTKHKVLPAGQRLGSPKNPMSPEQRAALRAQVGKDGRRRPHAYDQPTAERKFLPAPMYPATSGHGDSSYGVTLPDINRSSQFSSPESLRTSNKGESTIIFANESAKMQIF